MQVDKLQEILSTGRITRVTFFKRGDGQKRRMICRTGVRKGVKGDPTYDPASKGLVTVYDFQKKHFRNISAEAVIEVSSGPRKYSDPELADVAER